MRLIKASNIQLHEFYGDKIPEYGILSHTWENEEVSFQDLQTQEQSWLVTRAGYQKIKGCCALAVSQGLEYVWIDTCCIDKTSSAELTEAINSMFMWYEESKICWAYLADVYLSTFAMPNEAVDGYLRERNKHEFCSSRWYQRGWTLQELLAPEEVEFFNSEWAFLGTKSSLLSMISQATYIDRAHLVNHSNASVATKMSWASNRETTKVEDMAYCLMGLFEVNMPLLYGEGQKAFMRLQHEIVKISDDESIFAWEDANLGESGIFALSPAAFASSGDIVQSHSSQIDRPPYNLTNRGLSMELVLGSRCPLPSFDDSVRSGITFAELRCSQRARPVAIQLRRVSHTDFVRSSPSQLFHSRTMDYQPRSGYIRPLYTTLAKLNTEKYQFTLPPFWQSDPLVDLLETNFTWDEPRDQMQWTVTLQREQHSVGLAFKTVDKTWSVKSSRIFVVILGLTRYHPATADVVYPQRGETFADMLRDHEKTYFKPLSAKVGGGTLHERIVSVSFVNISTPDCENYYVNIEPNNTGIFDQTGVVQIISKI